MDQDHHPETHLVSQVNTPTYSMGRMLQDTAWLQYPCSVVTVTLVVTPRCQAVLRREVMEDPPGMLH